jgi:hypothetical protein
LAGVERLLLPDRWPKLELVDACIKQYQVSANNIKRKTPNPDDPQGPFSGQNQKTNKQQKRTQRRRVRSYKP